MGDLIKTNKAGAICKFLTESISGEFTVVTVKGLHALFNDGVSDEYKTTYQTFSRIFRALMADGTIERRYVSDIGVQYRKADSKKRK